MKVLRMRNACRKSLVVPFSVLLGLFAFKSDPPASAQNTETPETDQAASTENASKAIDKLNVATEEIPLSRQPYRVVIDVAFGRQAGISAFARERFADDFKRTCRRTWGAMWDADYRVHMGETPRAIGQLEELTADSVHSRLSEDSCDKAFFISIDSVGIEWTVTAREWDARSRTLTPVESETTLEVNLLDETLRDVMIRLFRPVLLLDYAYFDHIELRTQAGEFPAPDPRARQIVKGDVARPILRYQDKRDPTKILRIQELPLTFIVIHTVERSRVIGDKITGVGAAFGAKSRRVEQIALRERPRYSKSEVSLVLRGSGLPVVGHRVELIPKLRPRDEEMGPKLETWSDRNGTVQFEQDRRYPNFWVYVHSGREILARVPYVPGLSQKETIELPDDTIRLSVEGELSLLRGRLIDNVARRAKFMAFAQKHAKANEWEKTLEQLDAMKELDGLSVFRTDLNAIKVPALQRASAARNRVAQKRIARMCNDLDQVLGRFFDSSREIAFREKLETIRQDAELLPSAESNELPE